MVHSVRIQDHDGVLRDESAQVVEILRRSVWRSEPERVVTSFDLFDNGVDIWKVLLVGKGRKPVPSDYSIKLFMSLLLDFRISWDQCNEPLHD